MKSTTSSPDTVLMSWCRLTTLAPVISWISASMTGRGRFDQMRSYLFEKVPSLLGRKRLDQVLFGGCQNALEPDNEEISDQVSVNVLGSPPHVFLLKATDPFADSGLNFSLGFHGNIARSLMFGASQERSLGLVIKVGSY